MNFKNFLYKADEEFNDILKSFNTNDITSINKKVFEDGLSYVANINKNNQTSKIINDMITYNSAEKYYDNSYNYQLIYGWCSINESNNSYRVEYFISDVDKLKENLIPILKIK